MNAISAFLRSPLVEDPLIKRSGGFQLHPDAAPPSWWSLAMLSAMPGLQRERGGFVERLGQYLAQPAPSRSYMIPIGSKTMKPTHVLLGDPIELDSKGQLKDVPLALHYIELLAGMGQTQLLAAPNTVMAFQRLLEDLDAGGVWHPKNLRSQPKAASPVSYHCWPLAPDDGGLTARQADITFRLALIAKMRAGSRTAQRDKVEAIMDVNPAAIAALYADSGTNLMIHGHTHRPAVHSCVRGGTTFVRHVLTDWDCEGEITRGGGLAVDADGTLRVLPLTS